MAGSFYIYLKIEAADSFEASPCRRAHLRWTHPKVKPDVASNNRPAPRIKALFTIKAQIAQI